METKFYIEESEVQIDVYYETKLTGDYSETSTVIENCIVKTLVFDKEKKRNRLRKRREYVFAKGFDVWEKAVLRGREQDSMDIMEWYNNMLDISKTEQALENIPERIAYYLGGKQ